VVGKHPDHAEGRNRPLASGRDPYDGDDWSQQSGLSRQAPSTASTSNPSWSRWSCWPGPGTSRPRCR